MLTRIGLPIILFTVIFFAKLHLASAQVKISTISVSIEMKNASLADVLGEISLKTGISFSYNPKRLPGTPPINLSIKAQPLVTVLEGLSKQYGITYMMVENQIIIKEEKKQQQSSEPAKVFTLSGYVKNAATGEPLIGASVSVKGQQRATVTNGYGFFSIRLPKGVYDITCTYLGYQSNTRSIDLQSPVSSDIKMKEEVPKLKEIVVSDAAITADVITDPLPGKTKLLASAIELRPAFFGEPDVVKSLESLPGVKFHADGSTFFSVRGGNRDQNLILIDEAPIYNPSHMLGIFSTIIPDAVNDVNVYRGDMPASLGGRLSSVLEVRTKKGNDQHLSVWGNAGLISTKLGVEGPFRKDASSFLISTRLSRLKWLFSSISSDNINQFDFSDLTTKLNFKLNRSNRVLFSFYTGGDNYTADSTGISWRNNAATLRWNHLFGDRIFMNTTLAAAGYDYFLFTNVKTNTRWNARIANITFKNDLNFHLRPESELTAGFALNLYGFNPGRILSDNPLPPIPSLSGKNASELVLYVNHESRVNKRIHLNYGLRLSSWTATGEATEYTFNDDHQPTDTLRYAAGVDYHNYTNLEPRISMGYTLTGTSSVKLGYARNVQNIHLISNSTSPFNSLEVWLPSSINIRPQKSDQFTAGYYRDVPSLGATLSVETFLKKMTNQIDFESHPETLLNPLLEGALRFGTTRATGVEWMLRKDEGRLRGWVGYTYSRARMKFDDLNNGKTFNSFFDRPHQVNIMSTYDVSRRVNLGLNWIYSTGSPYTAPVSYFYYNGQEVPVYGDKNNARLPDYHRMDISATWKLNKNLERKFQHNISFSVYNVYARKNPLFVNYNKVQTNTGDYQVPSNLLDANRVTTQYYLFSFIPSISYNFRWQ